MESKAFHICPFCQAQNPASVSRCVRCARSLAGLPLPVYGSELDAEMRPNASADLVDLPLRDTMADAPPLDLAPVTAAAPANRASRRPFQRRRDARTARLGVVAGLMGAAGLLGTAVLVGGWLVRAQDRDETTTVVPAVTVPPVTAAPALPPARPASPRTVAAAAPPPVRVASPEETPSRPIRRPAAEVMAVHPDVAAAPVDVERARDDFESDAPGETQDAGARAALRGRLDRAQQHRDAVAARVRELRARTNVPVIKDIEEYQRLQEDLSAALDELDQADTQVRRFRRALNRRAE